MKNNSTNKIFIRGIGISSSPPLNNILDCLNIKNKNKKDLSITTKIRQFYEGKGILWTISATESLKIIIGFLNYKKGRRAVIGFPTYFCNEVLESIKELCIIEFYDITNTNLLNNELKKNKYDAIILCNYFGETSNNCIKNNIKKIYKGVIIYDNAHLSIPNIELNDENEFIIMSLYKHYPIREGGCLIYDKNLKLENKKSKITLNTINLIFKNVFLDILFIFKKIITRNFAFITRIKTISKDPFGDFNKFKKTDHKLKKLSIISKIILNSPICDYKKTSKSNKISRELIVELLLWAGISKKDLISKEYALEINVKEKYINTLEQLNKAGLPIMRWPQLNKNLKKNNSHMRNTISLWNKKMYVICNSSIDKRKCEFLKKRFINNSNLDIKINFLKISESEYEKIKYELDYSSYLQSNYYIKSYSEKYNFYKINIGKKNIGKFGVCIKRKFNLDFLVINRVKISQKSNSLRDFEIGIIYKELIHFLKKEFKRSLLFMITIEKNYLENIFTNYSKNLFKSYEYQTGIIDLSKNEEELKRQMKGRWRNALKNGFKLGIDVEICKEKKDLYEIFDLYKVEKKRKHYDGINSNLLKKWYENTKNSGELIAFKGYKKSLNHNIFLGSIVINIHDVTATYLIAVNNSERRTNFLSNILLWESILYAKNDGCIFYDLGGIDQIKTPGIASFKLGLNPKLHEDNKLTIALI